MNETAQKNGLIVMGIYGFILALQAILLFATYRLVHFHWAVAIALPATGFLLLTIMKGSISSKGARQCLAIFKASISACVLTLSNMPLVFFATKTSVGVPIFIFIMVNVIVLVGLISFFKKSTVLSAFEKYLETDMKKPTIKKSKNEGDVVICKSAETGKDVIIPYKDRFLHMLVLGATGTGKTSQVLLPLIAQDMQNKEMGITVIEPKGDLAEKSYAMAQYYGRPALYFNPVLPDCPHFNPLYGREEDVLENLATTFKMLNPDSPQYFLDLNETLIRNSIKVLKRVENDPAGLAQEKLANGKNATLIDLSRIVHNAAGTGREIATAFSKVNGGTEAINKENADIYSWFSNDYFMEKSKIYENSSGLRSQITNIISNPHLRRVLNPIENEAGLNFDRHLAEGGVLCITTAQGALRDLGSYLGYFIILQLQSAVFKRPGTEFTRRSCSLYIDEFQVYSNPGFADMLTQGRSYRVASHLATQNRALMAMGAGRDGKNFVSLVSTNARNVILFPGGSYEDADYYAKQFGEVEKQEVEISVSQKKFNPLYGFDKVGYASESRREKVTKEARFSPTDIIYRPFGEILYCIVQNNTVQKPGVGKVAYIDKGLNDALDQMVRSYNSPIVHFQEEKGGIGDYEEKQKALDEYYKTKDDLFINDLGENAGADPQTTKETRVENSAQQNAKRPEREAAPSASGYDNTQKIPDKASVETREVRNTGSGRPEKKAESSFTGGMLKNHLSDLV